MQLLTKKQQIVPVLSHNPDDYPINYLRNVAIERSQTSHVFVTDLDLWPSGMESILELCVDEVYNGFLSLPQNRLQQSNLAIVVPTFSLRSKLDKLLHNDCKGTFDLNTFFNIDIGIAHPINSDSFTSL